MTGPSDFSISRMMTEHRQTTSGYCLDCEAVDACRDLEIPRS